MQNFKDLKVWKWSHQLALQVYEHTATFPRTEVYSLTSQVQRASASIPANIAEGCGRGSNADLTRFLYIALGSASELKYLLLLSKDLGYISSASYDNLDQSIREVKRMLTALITRVKSVGAKRQLTTDN